MSFYGDKSKTKFTEQDTNDLQKIAQDADAAAAAAFNAYVMLANQEKAIHFKALQKATTEKAKQLQQACANPTLLQDINLFVQNVGKATIQQTNLSAIEPDRAKIASYTQGRLIGQAAPKKQAVSASATQFASFTDAIVAQIKEGKYDAALKRLQANADRINQTTSDEFEDSVLISAIVFLGLSKKGDPKNPGDTQLSQFILELLKLPKYRSDVDRFQRQYCTASSSLVW
ncbi:MAG: hypothetical protein ACRCXC_00545 [Legionella sp.]